jgi:hypothetical protein
MRRFSQWRHNRMEIFGTDLPDFCQNFQQYIDDGTIVPGWHGNQNFRFAGQARHISASMLKCLIPPGSVTKALHSHNQDREIWLNSYKEEYDGLTSNNTFPLSDDDPMSPSSIPSLNTFCDANWGPQDASQPLPTNMRPVSIDESKSICGHLFLMGGLPYFMESP